MGPSIALPDLEIGVGLGEALPQTSVIHPVIIVVIGTHPEIPFAVIVIVAGPASATEVS